MNKNWFAWGLSALLLTSVLVGLVVEGPRSIGADPVSAPAPAREESELPRFECEDLTKQPYDLSDADPDRDVAWFEDTFALDLAQAEQMNTVFVDAAQRADTFWTEARDNYCALRKQFFGDIRSVLTPTQLVQLEEILAEKRLRRAQKRAGAGSKLRGVEPPPMGKRP